MTEKHYKKKLEEVKNKNERRTEEEKNVYYRNQNVKNITLAAKWNSLHKYRWIIFEVSRTRDINWNE